MLKNFRKLKKGTQRIHIAVLSTYMLFLLILGIYNLVRWGRFYFLDVVIIVLPIFGYVLLVLIYAWIKDGYRQDKANRLNKDNAQQN